MKIKLPFCSDNRIYYTGIKKEKINTQSWDIWCYDKDLIIVRIGEDQCLIEQLCENFVRIRCFDINEEKEIW